MGLTPIDLPNGDHVVFKDPSRITERDRRRMKQAIVGFDDATIDALVEAEEKGTEFTPSMFSKKDMLAVDELNDAVLVSLILHWKRPVGDEGQEIDVPPTVDSLLDLDSPSYDLMSTTAAPLIEAIHVDFSAAPPGVNPPTTPASD